MAIPTAEEISADSRRRLRLKEQIARVKGDLDWIVMKCLEKDRQRRYTEAESLERLVQLYDAWGKPAQAAQWKQKLAAFQQAANKAAEKKEAQP